MMMKRYVRRVGSIVLLYPNEYSTFPEALYHTEINANAVEAMEEGRMYEAEVSVTVKIY